MSIISGPASALIGANASGNAASAQSDASMKAMVMQWKQAQQAREDWAPWREAGKNALHTLQERVAQGPGNYTQSPGYEVRLAEGQRAIEGSAASRGNLLSGAAQKALLRHGQDYATNDYDNFLKRYYDSLTPYQSMAGLGMTATGGTVASGTNMANQASSYLQNMGNAQAAGYINSANAITGGINSGINNALAGYNAWRNFSGAAGAAGAGAAASASPAAVEALGSGETYNALRGAAGYLFG